MKRFVLIFAALATLASQPSRAQNSEEDWDFGRDADKNLVIAAVSFDNFGIAVRCRENVLSVVASGLPVAEGVRTIKYSMAGSPEENSTWVGAPRSPVAFALWPASIASDLRQGGRLSLGVRDADRVKRIAVDLPPSPSAIGQVFTACGRELPTDTSDAPTGTSLGALRWVHAPQPSFPSRTASEAGIAALLCDVDARGGLRRCKVESEFPEGGGFGRAATLGAHQTGRVSLPEGSGGVLEGRQISFVVRYMMSDDIDFPVATRLPAREAN